MKKRILLLLSFLLLITSITYAAPTALFLSKDKSQLSANSSKETRMENIKFTESILLAPFKDKIQFVSTEAAFKTLSLNNITDFDISERADIISALNGQDVKYVFLMTYKEDTVNPWHTGKPPSVEINLKIIDMVNNKYLINMTVSSSEMTSIRKLVQKDTEPMLQKLIEIIPSLL